MSSRLAAVLPLLAVVLLTAACGSSGKPSALQSYLAKHYGVQASALPPHPTTISARQAEDLVSATPISKGHRITAAGLWRVTDPRLFIPEHGIHRLLVHNQVVWIVLVHGVNITGVCDLCQTPPKPVIGAEAVFVNAENGRQNGFLPLPARTQ